MSVLCYKSRPRIRYKSKTTITQTVYERKSNTGEATAHKLTRNTEKDLPWPTKYRYEYEQACYRAVQAYTHAVCCYGTLTAYVENEWRYSCLQLYTTSRSWTRGQDVTWWHSATKDYSISIVHMLLDAMHITPGAVSRSVQPQVFWSHRSGSVTTLRPVGQKSRGSTPRGSSDSFFGSWSYLQPRG